MIAHSYTSSVSQSKWVTKMNKFFPCCAAFVVLVIAITVQSEDVRIPKADKALVKAINNFAKTASNGDKHLETQL